MPHIQPTRRIPEALHSKVQNKLNELERQQIIKKVEKPTQWLNSLVIVEKRNGDIRLCLHPMYLNGAMQREYFLIPTADEIVSKLNKFLFTVIDMKDGYFQVKIDDDSSDTVVLEHHLGDINLADYLSVSRRPRRVLQGKILKYLVI